MKTRRVMFLAVLCSAIAFCQVAPKQPGFEVASIRPATEKRGRDSLGPSIVSLHLPLKLLLVQAYGIGAVQISGPSWITDTYFDVVAKMPDGATKDQIPQMLQALLTERFKLSSHWETRSMPAYELRVGNNGFKLAEADPAISVPPGVRLQVGSLSTAVTGRITIARLAQLLSNFMKRPVTDLTGLKGTYDIDISWANGLETGEWIENSLAAPGDSVFFVLQDKLGLKLKGRTMPVAVLVVDHAERVPTEN